MTDSENKPAISKRFRGFLPVVVDVETGGFNSETDALLEVAAITLQFDDQCLLKPDQTFFYHVMPFPGANLDQSSLAFTKIDPFHPLRKAVSETEAVRNMFRGVRKALAKAECKKAILVGHNPSFDLAFIKAACVRNQIGNNPFHPFSTFDTATLGGLAYGQTVLAKALKVAGIGWNEADAHTAIYDADKTAQLFCRIVNTWQAHVGVPSLDMDNDDRLQA